MTDIMGKEFDQPLYASCAHERWYTAGIGGGGGGGGDDDDDEDGGQRGNGCRPGGPPRICLVSSIVSRTPSTPYLMRSYRRTSTATDAASGEMPGDHRPGAVSALRATTAAPWYMAEHAVQKELSLGRATSDFESRGGKTSPADGEDSGESEGDAAIEEATTHAPRHDDASRVTTTLRFIDGAIASNNPTAVGVFEARRLFPRDRKLCVVSVGTGAALPREVPGTGYAQSQAVSNLIAATCDVTQVDATVRHVLGAGDSYFSVPADGSGFRVRAERHEEGDDGGAEKGGDGVSRHGGGQGSGGGARGAAPQVRGGEASRDYDRGLRVFFQKDFPTRQNLSVRIREKKSWTTQPLGLVRLGRRLARGGSTPALSRAFRGAGG